MPHRAAYVCKALNTGHSTEIALLSINNLNNEVPFLLLRSKPIALVLLVLLDLSAAFVTIDYSTLLSSLQVWFGNRVSVLKWFTSYLIECFHWTKIGSTLSDLGLLLFGVPKVLFWAFMFLLYTTLSLVTAEHKGIQFHSYSDDNQVCVYLSQKNVSVVFE